MSKHTPGPWVRSQASGIWDTVVSSDGTTIARCFKNMPGSVQHTQDNIVANANLIAAAPELLEACELVFGALPIGATILKEKLEAAIKKAKGE